MTTAVVSTHMRQQIDQWASRWFPATLSRTLELRALVWDELHNWLVTAA